jgi:murein L,D-transpeptidase YcbB/YkuD
MTILPGSDSATDWRSIMRRLLLASFITLFGAISAAWAQTADDPLTAQLRNRFAAVPAQQTINSSPTIDSLLQNFYVRRRFAPAWNDPQRVQALLAELHKLDEDGVDPNIYPLAKLAAGVSGSDPGAQADFEALASRCYLQAIADLHRGRVDPRSLSADWRIERPALDAALIDKAYAAVDAGNLADVFNAARPQHPLYVSLRGALHNLRALEAQGGWPSIADGPTLKPGVIDERVRLLRTRLAAEGYPATAPATTPPQVFDEALGDAVRQYQAAQYLHADGHVGAATLAELNVPLAQRIAQLRVNLERARWLLPSLESDLLIVDVAGFRATLYRGAVAVWRARVQVGRETRRTPMLKSTIRYLTLNPNWTVPPTILKKDILPKVRKDPGYLAKEHIHVFDAQGKEVPADRIDWSKPGGLTLKQDAGPDAALGNVAFRFANPFSIYLHDTPHRDLFKQGKRAYSSGCIRVDDAHQLAVLLLDDAEHWSSDALEKALADPTTRNVSLTKPVPILIAYWTVDLRGTDYVAFKPDLYGLDAPTLAALDAPYPTAP